jgi:putative methyltransferase (TIGR04325 family)
MTKRPLHDILPPFLIRFLTGILYGWHGNYSSWDEAKRKVTGYNSKNILDKVTSSALKVRDGDAVYERDSVIFDKIQYSFPVLSGLMWISALNNGKLNVLDFGGSLGSTYFQNKKFLDTIREVNWCIIEQPEFVSVGIEKFANDRLHFFYTIEECIKNYEIDVIILSSVLQYLEEPYKLLQIINTLPCKYLILDRTPFIKGKNRITIQKVNPKIYHGSYPCWFFSENEFLNYMTGAYKIVTEFTSLDKANISSEFKGYLFEKLI